MKPVNRIYVHFADFYHVERARLNRVTTDMIRRTLSAATRLSLLFADEVVFPASSVFESPECQRLMSEFPEFLDHGVLRMSAGDATVTDHLESKLSAYNSTSTGYFLRAYRKSRGLILPTYIEKKGSSTREISAAWRNTLENHGFIARIRDETGIDLPVGFERIWAGVPEGLQGQAFVPTHAAEVLRQQGFAGGGLEHLVARPIERAYIDGYGSALDAYVLLGVPYLSYALLETDLRTPFKLRYQNLLAGLNAFGLASLIGESPSAALFTLWCQPEWDDFARGVLSPTSSKDLYGRAAHLRRFLESESLTQKRACARGGRVIQVS